jgi:hypothetical protein
MGDELKSIQQGTQNCLSKQFRYAVASVPVLADAAFASSHLTSPDYTVVANNPPTGTCNAIDTTDQISYALDCHSSATDPTTESDSNIRLCKHMFDAIGQCPIIESYHSIYTDADQVGHEENAICNESDMAIECDQHNIKRETLSVAAEVTGLETGTDGTTETESQSRSAASAESLRNFESVPEHKEEIISNLKKTFVHSDQEKSVKHQILPVPMEEKTAEIITADENVIEGGQSETEVAAVDCRDDVAKTSVLEDFAEDGATELNVTPDVSYKTPLPCTTVCESFYPESVREVSALLQRARCSSPPQTSPPHSTPQLAAVAASSSHSCGSLYAQCGASHHEPVSLNEILTEREHLPSFYRYHIDAIDYRLQGPLVEDEEALVKEYHKQQQRFLMGNGVSVGPCSATSPNTAVTAGSLQSAENGQTQKASPITATPLFRISQPEGYDYLKGLVPQLKREAKDWEAKSDSLEAEVLELRRKLRMREQEIMRLQREVHKLKASATQRLAFWYSVVTFGGFWSLLSTLVVTYFIRM